MGSKQEREKKEKFVMNLRYPRLSMFMKNGEEIECDLSHAAMKTGVSMKELFDALERNNGVIEVSLTYAIRTFP